VSSPTVYFIVSELFADQFSVQVLEDEHKKTKMSVSGRAADIDPRVHVNPSRLEAGCYVLVCKVFLSFSFVAIVFGFSDATWNRG
jgi:hypothetical protein